MPRVRRSRTRHSLLASVGWTESFDEADEALMSARSLGDKALLLRALVARGSIASFDADVMRPYLAEAADLARELGDTWRLGQILAWQATAALIGGDAVTTIEAAQAGLRLADELGDRFVSRQCRIWIANARMFLGDLSAAADLFRQAIDEASAAHDVLIQAIGLLGESPCAGLAGGYQRCQGGLRRGSELLRRSLATTTTRPVTASLRSPAWPPVTPLRRGRRVRQQSGTPHGSP